MRRSLVVVISVVLVVAGVGSAILVTRSASAASGEQARKTPAARQFVGYWMGIDPLDGGDSRRGITRNANGTFSVIGRDSAFTLCDGTDRAVITLSDAAVAGPALAADDLLITCFANGSTVTLRVRYDVIDANTIRETVTSQAGELVDEIIFHRVSRG